MRRSTREPPSCPPVSSPGQAPPYRIRAGYRSSGRHGSGILPASFPLFIAGGYREIPPPQQAPFWLWIDFCWPTHAGGPDGSFRARSQLVIGRSSGGLDLPPVAFPPRSEQLVFPRKTAASKDIRPPQASLRHPRLHRRGFSGMVLPAPFDGVAPDREVVEPALDVRAMARPETSGREAVDRTGRRSCRAFPWWSRRCRRSANRIRYITRRKPAPIRWGPRPAYALEGFLNVGRNQAVPPFIALDYR